MALINAHSLFCLLMNKCIKYTDAALQVLHKDSRTSPEDAVSGSMVSGITNIQMRAIRVRSKSLSDLVKGRQGANVSESDGEPQPPRPLADNMN